MKNFLRILLVCLLVLSLAPSAYAAEKKVPFLLYHSVCDELSDNDDILLHITKDNFLNHMMALKEAGYETVTIDDYVNFTLGEDNLPEKPIVICFDDGYENNYINAYPILKELNMKATIFVIASRVGNRSVEFPHFDWEQAAEMEKSGVISIQSHSMTHPEFTNLTFEQTVREMRLSKYLVEKNLNKTCNYMAYPYGFTNSMSAQIGKSAGYKALCIVGNEGANGMDANIFEIKRLNVSADMSTEALLRYIEENIAH